MNEERRGNQRRRTLKKGRIVFGQLSRVYDCTIRNVSETGALLLVPNSTGIPDNFLLYVDAEQNRRPAEIIWRRDDRVGIRYTGPAESALKRA